MLARLGSVFLVNQKMSKKSNDSLIVLGRVLLVLQGVLAYYVISRRVSASSLGVSFPTYYQAFSYFAQGHFNLGPSYGGAPFLRLTGDFTFFGLSAIGVFFRSPLVLGGLYVLLLFGTNFLTLSYSVDFLRTSSKSEEISLRNEAIVLMLVLMNPFYYLAILGDFNFEWVFAIFFAIILLRPASATKLPLRSIAILGSCLTGIFGAIVLAVVGVSRALTLGISNRIEGVVEGAVGVGWLVILTMGGFDAGINYSHFLTTYAPSLAVLGNSGLVPGIGRLLSSWSGIASIFRANLTQILYVASAGGMLGILGFLGPISLIFTVVGAMVFTNTSVAIEPAIGYSATILFCASTVRAVRAISKVNRRLQSLVMIVVAVSIVVSFGYFILTTLSSPAFPLSGIDRAAMDQVVLRIPYRAQVIGDPMLLGRLADHQYLNSDLSTAPILIKAPIVFFVFTSGSPNSLTLGVSSPTKFSVVQTLGAKLIYQTGSISLYKWIPNHVVSFQF
ncbi:unnamed protein product [Acidithrix sp. C25]|nr:unnamed protein product [Acidithrix sp. C25]